MESIARSAKKIRHVAKPNLICWTENEQKNDDNYK